MRLIFVSVQLILQPYAWYFPLLFPYEESDLPGSLLGVTLREVIELRTPISKRFHIPRTLRIGDRTMPEVELLSEPGVALVLSEPGAGKTNLLCSVAERLGVMPVRASTVRSLLSDTSLVVDAFDEVARIGDARVYDILHTISQAGPDRVLLSSRSGEWENAQTRFISDLFGRDVLVAHLVPLDDDEQRQLFEHRHPDRSFDAFHADIRRFDLHHLLGNPEFLRLFAGAYEEADGQLSSRGDVFTLAIEYLARETNPDVIVRGAQTRHQRIAWANEMFAKLLLSGADGIAVGDIAEDNLHPQFQTIGLAGDGPPSVLGTRLFRPGTNANQHEPVHRIVAEYGAAQHLVGLIEDPSHRLTTAQCLALIAPNGATRDDLRGLLGWMAALGSQSIQNEAIALDPYAVLSNGDPSRLTLTSRIKLLDALAELNAEDPYFRRSDRWRSFSASGFFTPDIVDVVRPTLAQPDQGQLRELLLELLIGSPAVPALRTELEAILLDDSAYIGPRLDATSCLLGDNGYQPIDTLRRLIASGTNDALRLASQILMHMAGEAPYELLREMLEAAVGLYPGGPPDRSRTIGDRYFLTRLIQETDLQTIVRLLDDLTDGLHCTCNKDRHDCYCRNGVSKIVGLLLNTYFERASGPHDPDQIWIWLRNLHFHGQRGTKQSTAVEAIQADDALRRALHERAFARLACREDILNMVLDVVQGYGHSGLQLKAGDARHLIDLAHDTDNPALWIEFAPSHHYWAKPEERGPDDLRRHCREQAQEKPTLMREWARINRARKRQWNEMRPRRYRFQARRRRRERRLIEANTTFFHANRPSVESGENANWTHHVARAYLIEPDRVPEVTHGLFDAEAVLRRSLQTLGDRCPTIEEIGQGDKRGWTEIFLAGALAEFRAKRNLDDVAPEILNAIRSNATGYNTFTDEEHEAFLAELRRRVPLTYEEAEAYARKYLEPSLALSARWSDIYLFHREPAFEHLLSSLPLEWLQRFPELPVQTLETLFEMAARHGDRAALLALIRQRCLALDEGVLPHPQEEQRAFWFLRDFWFANKIDESVWAFMERNPETVLWLEDRRHRGRERDDIWTPLSAAKIERILCAYLPQWPVVPLPSSWGTGSPKGETAYRYLRDIVWQIGQDDPSVALPIVERLLSMEITAPSHNDLRSIRADLRRKAALTSYHPRPSEVAASLDGGPPASVEQLRKLVVELLHELQKDVRAGDTGMIDQFYNGAGRLGEVAAMYRVSAWLKPRLHPFGIHDVSEHRLGDRNRCDLTVTRMVSGRASMLVIEGKGQWHKDLFSAATSQLADRYSMHPSADEQGIYLVLWYGPGEMVAGSKRHAYGSAAELQAAINADLPAELQGRLDTVVLDVSRAEPENS